MGTLRIDHVGLVARSLAHAADYLAEYGITMHIEHRAGWAPIGPAQYLHVLPAGEDTFMRKQVARLLDADVRWASWSVTAPPHDLRRRPVGADLEDGLDMQLGKFAYLTNDGGVKAMMRSNGFLPYCSAYFPESTSTADLVAAIGGAPIGMSGVCALELGGEDDALRSWLGGTLPGVAFNFGSPTPGLHSVTLSTRDGPVVLDCGALPS